MPKLKYNICVSGAAKGDSVTFAKSLAKAVGTQIVEQGHVVVTGRLELVLRRSSCSPPRRRPHYQFGILSGN